MFVFYVSSKEWNQQIGAPEGWFTVNQTICIYEELLQT
jgi:hypothetical protein